MTLLGYNIDCTYPVIPATQKKVINTINPHSYCVAKKDDKFQKALKEADILIPDGTGIVWAARMLKGKTISRITGTDMHAYLLKQAQEHQLKVFYMGSSDETLFKIKERIQKEYPAISCGTYSPPYKAVFSEEDNQAMRDAINSFRPDILFVGMTAPKQEKWVHQNREELQANVICSIGAVFDFYAGTVERPGPFWQKLGLEWLPRLLREPKRLWHRNFISTPKFLLEVAFQKLVSD